MRTKEKAEISPKFFTLPHPSPYRLGSGIDIVKLMENMRHIEKALVKLGVNQCRNCSEILPYSALGIGGICETCWIEDEHVLDYDFSEMSEHEILRHLRKLPLFSDMARRDAAILKAEPGHRFAFDRRFLLRESYAAALPRTTKYDKSPYRWSTKQGVYLAGDAA